MACIRCVWMAFTSISTGFWYRDKFCNLPCVFENCKLPISQLKYISINFFLKRSIFTFRLRTYDTTKVHWCIFDPKLMLFAVFSVVLVTGDLGSDSVQTYIYIESGDFYWGYSTLIIVFVPFATICVSEFLYHSMRCCRGETVTRQDFVKSIKTICRCFIIFEIMNPWPSASFYHFFLPHIARHWNSILSSITY